MSAARPEGELLARLFMEGQHQAVLDASFDRGDAPSGEDAAWVVGSLSLLGRLDEALSLAESFDGARSEVVVATRFFVIVGLCHGGRYDEAKRWVRRNLAFVRDPNALTRFYVFQGIALHRYFTGAVGRARLGARRALREAVRAHFAYGRLLALDLSGHVLCQRGEVSAGLRVLTQAERLARSLGASSHAIAIECAHLAYQNRHGRGGPDLEEALSRVAVTSTDNLYALRAAWLELAFRGAIQGDAVRARDALERAREQALPERDHRARARLLLVEAILARLDGSEGAVFDALAEAGRALDRGDDLVLRTELSLWDAVLGAAVFDGSAARAAELRRRSGTVIADFLWAMNGGAAPSHVSLSESPLWALLTLDAPVGERAAEAIRRGWLGLLPLLFAPSPGRYLFFVGDALISADRGTVSQQDRLPGHAREILETLRRGPRSKEELVREIWRVGRYAPHLHDAVLHTAVARVRRAMGSAAEWLETTPGGYALREDVALIVLRSAGIARDADADADADPDETSNPTDAPREPPAPLAPPAPSEDLAQALLRVLARGPASIAQLEDASGASPATVLRRLRELIAKDLVIREGRGKRTRYRRA